MTIATLASSRITATYPDGLYLPNVLPSKPLPPVIYLHGAGGDASSPITGSGDGSRLLFEALVSLGYVVVFPTTYSQWGNSIADSTITAAIAFARTQGAHPTAKAILIGGSMGGATVLRYTALHPNSISCVIGLVPALDYDALISADTLGLRASINLAWGRSSGTTTALPTGISPATLASLLSKSRIQLHYASDDAVSTNIATFQATSGCDIRSVGALGHSTQAIAAANISEMIKFIQDTAVVDAITFTPAELPGLLAWYDANDLVALGDGTAVDTWTDKSGNGFSLTQTSTARPLLKTYVRNGLPVVRFDGINVFIKSTAAGLGALLNGNDIPFSIYCAFAQSSTALTQAPMAWANSAANAAFTAAQILDATRVELRQLDDAAAQVTSLINYTPDTAWHVYGASWTVASSDVNLDTVGVSAVRDPGTQTLNAFALGAKPKLTPSQFFAGDIAEAIVVSQYASVPNHRRAIRYLGDKWGVTVI